MFSGKNSILIDTFGECSTSSVFRLIKIPELSAKAHRSLQSHRMCALNKLRLNCIFSILASGGFQSKNISLFSVENRYCSILIAMRMT